MAVLDTRHGRVLLLDARMQAAWRSCAGLSSEEIASRLGETLPAVGTMLRELAEAGLVTSDGDTWRAAEVRWV